MQVSMVQHSVGQGGFLTGQLDCGPESLYWAYDCGSNQSMPLNREISRAATKGSFRLLFLSHLDSDHINGIDRLLATTTVIEVVLPYLEEADFAVAIASDIDTGRLTGLFLDFAAGPAAWLVGRGVRRITFVRPSDDDQAPSGGPEPISPDGTGDGDGPIEVKWSRVAETQQMADHTIQFVDTSAVVLTKTSSQFLDWVLAPYAVRPSKARAEKFLRSLRRTFGKRSLKAIVSEVRSAEGRTKLRACYDDLWQDHNLVSMSLYSGPVSSELGRWDVQAFQSRFERNWWNFAPGWLSTGDMNLASVRRRNSVINHYRRFAAAVGVLVLPHHGSIHSFHPDILDGFPQLHVAIASAGDNQYGHPHRGVREAVEGHNGTYFAHVNEAPVSAYYMQAST